MTDVTGMTRAAAALRYWERRQEIVANNLANADTQGFRAERSFARALGDAVPEAGAATDMRAGALKPTGNPLDLALGGEGFFVVETPQGERLTRNGGFQLDVSGRLVDHDGNAVLGEGGPLVAPPGSGEIQVDPAGRVTAGGREIGTLRIEGVAPGAQLVHDGGTRFLPDASRAPLDPAKRSVRQGFLEDSNVNTIDSMVDMVSIQRSYAAVQRTITTLDQIRHTISNELGKV